MTRERTRRARPLDARSLEELAVRYVGRFATTRAKLLQYLGRKIRERGWEGEAPPDAEGLAVRMADLGYVDDRAFAMARETSHTARGLGARRLSSTLRAAGVAEEDGADAMAMAGSNALASALRLAERRKIGPFARAVPLSPREREKSLAALVRGGHGYAIARSIVDLAPGDEDGLAELRDRFANDDR